jgi:hypothetical protein
MKYKAETRFSFIYGFAAPMRQRGDDCYRVGAPWITAGSYVMDILFESSMLFVNMHAQHAFCSLPFKFLKSFKKFEQDAHGADGRRGIKRMRKAG